MRLLTIPEVSARLGLGRTKTLQLLRDGELLRLNIGRSVRVPESAVESFIEQRIAEALGEAQAERKSEAEPGAGKPVVPGRPSDVEAE